MTTQKWPSLPAQRRALEWPARSDSSSANEPTMAVVALWPTAYRFKRGHRIRIQVSSGAFPRFARNPGTGEPHTTATRLLAADQSVYHDPARPSAITLPIRKA
jgi:uncharacterized protein